jgi:hypothetical protein
MYIIISTFFGWVVTETIESSALLYTKFYASAIDAGNVAFIANQESKEIRSIVLIDNDENRKQLPELSRAFVTEVKYDGFIWLW